MLAQHCLPTSLSTRYHLYRPAKRLGQLHARCAVSPEQDGSIFKGQAEHLFNQGHRNNGSGQPVPSSPTHFGTYPAPGKARIVRVAGPSKPYYTLFSKVNLARAVTSGEEELQATGEEVEKFWQRLALLFTGAVLLAERLTGGTAVERLNIGQTGVPLHETEPALLMAIAVLLAAALYPSRTSIWNQIRSNSIPFVERSRNILGRLAFLSLASIFTVEAMTGEGALTLLNIETGVEALSELEIGSAFVAMLLLTRPDNDE